MFPLKKSTLIFEYVNQEYAPACERAVRMPVGERPLACLNLRVHRQTGS